MSRIPVVLVLIIALLVVTNPSRSEFNAWAQSHVARKIEEEARKKGVDANDGSSQLGGAIAGFFIASMMDRVKSGIAASLASPDSSCRLRSAWSAIRPSTVQVLGVTDEQDQDCRGSLR
jgi:hypothetical protein